MPEFKSSECERVRFQVVCKLKQYGAPSTRKKLEYIHIFVLCSGAKILVFLVSLWLLYFNEIVKYLVHYSYIFREVLRKLYRRSLMDLY